MKLNFKRFILIYFFSFFLIPVLSIAQNQKYFRHLSIENGLSQNNVVSIVQDEEGYIWMATKNGLNRYDGDTFTVFEQSYKKGDGMSSSRLNVLASDMQGRIWIGSDGEGLDYYDKKTEKIQHFANPDFKGTDIRKIVLDKKQNVLWILTERGLNKVSLHDFKVNYIPFKSKGNDTDFEGFSLLKTPNNEILVGSLNKGIFKLENESYFVKYYSKGLSYALIRDLLISSDEKLWIATEGTGLHCLNLNDTSSSFTGNLLEAKEVSKIMSLIEDSEGNIWVGSENQGLFSFENGEKKYLNYANDLDNEYSISHNSIYSIYQDHQGRIWAGTFNKGVNVWDKYAIKFQLYRKQNKPNSLSSNTVSSFEEGKNTSEVWVGTDGGGLNLWNREKNTFKTFTKTNTENFTSDAILNITSGTNNDFWIGTWGGGFMYLNQKTKKFENFASLGLKGAYANNVFDIDFGSDGNLWFASFDHGLSYYNISEKRIYSMQELLEEGHFHVMGTTVCVENDNTIWLGTINGIFKYTKKENGKFVWKKYDKGDKSKLSGKFINALYKSHEGKIYVASAEGGLSVYNAETDTFEVYNKESGFPSNELNAIQEDHQGNLWISSSKGLFSFNPKTKAVKTYSTKDGLQNLNFFKNSAFRLSNNELLFGGIEGFNVFHPEEILANPFKPHVFFKDLKLFNESVDFNEEGAVITKPLKYTEQIELNHEQTVFSIVYSGLNLTQADENQFAYMLEGFEDTWNYVGNTQQATYTNLDAGDYVFKVKMTTAGNDWTDEVQTLKIKVLPPWWETLWFKLLVILFLVSGTVTFYKLRVKMLKHQKQKLEQTVEERTKELVQKQNEVETQNEELRQQSEEIEAQRDSIEHQRIKLEETLSDVQDKNELITSSIRYAQTIQQAILPSQERLTELFGKYFVIYEPKDIVSGDFFWSTQRGKYRFLAVLDCTGHGVPGAFMSMIGNTLLNRIVKELQEYDTSQILHKLNQGVINSLRQRTSKNADGMDAVIVRIEDKEDGTYQVQFSGAKNHVFHFSNSTDMPVEIHKGTKKAVGGIFYEYAVYKKERFTVEKGDLLVLASDGFSDMRKADGKKIGTGGFIELINEGERNPEMLQQIFDQKIMELKAHYPSRDDITIVGIRV